MLKIDSYEKRDRQENSMYFMEFNVNSKDFMKFIPHAFRRSETKKMMQQLVICSWLVKSLKIARYITELWIYYTINRCKCIKNLKRITLWAFIFFSSQNVFCTSSSYKSFGQFGQFDEKKRTFYRNSSQQTLANR